jgi:single-stranded-DNA-specific exonuclease
VRRILDDCQREPVGDRQAGLVFAGEGWHRGVVGIVASRLVERFHRPVIVLSEDPERGIAQGSGRSVPGFHLLEALESMAGLLIRFGGHRQAAGLTLARERVGELRERFNAWAAARLRPDDFRPVLEFDAAIEFRQITDRSAAELLSLAPFGFGNPPPLLAACGVEVAGEPAVWNGKNLRVRLRQNGRTLMVKAWNFAPRIAELQPGTAVDAALSFEEDPYSLSRGYPGWCAVLRDVRPAAGAAPTGSGSTSG